MSRPRNVLVTPLPEESLSTALIVVIAAVVLVPLILAILFKVLWKVPAADEALIVTGFGVKGKAVGDRIFKIVTGGGAFVGRR